ncbi:MAG: mechanosensitive ion channel protein MscS [Deltaproteobacteria bacterium RBG_19FT_COMBO_43_11]|nr:MAG: mechanosensitive ion channel protein MscS [Deltaproteobacteria bacterium RBG_19FT_COMBO_43_11]
MFWNEVYFGNSIKDWVIAFVIILVVFLVLKVIQKIAIAKISRFARKTKMVIDDFLLDVLSKTKFFTLLVVAVYAGSYALDLKPEIIALWQKVVVFVLILQAGFWAGSGITFWLGRTVRKRMDEDAASATTITFLGFLARIFLWAIVLLLVLDNLGFNITTLVAGLGIGGIAIALAMQNILGDLFASLSIVLDKPFVIGDFIIIDQLMGTIEHIGMKTTRIRSLSGEQLIFSNSDLLKSRIHNYKRMSERRIVFSFGVIYQTSLEKLKLINNIISDIIKSQQQARFDRVHFKEYGESSLNFEVVYFVTDPDYNIYMDLQQAINLEMFRRFQEEGIEFAYPTTTLFIQHEGKL